jgi:membrane dipeptidase
MHRTTWFLGPLALSLLIGMTPGGPAAEAAEETKPDPALVERAQRILREVPLIDGHNDLPWELRQRVSNHLDKLDLSQDTRKLEKPMMTDLARLKQGGVGGQFWSAR